MRAALLALLVALPLAAAGSAGAATCIDAWGPSDGLSSAASAAVVTVCAGEYDGPTGARCTGVVVEQDGAYLTDAGLCH